MHDYILKMNFTNTAINHSIINNTIDLISGGGGGGSGGGGGVISSSGNSNSSTIGNSNASSILESSSESTTAFTSAIVSSAMHFRNAFDATRMFPGNGTHLIDLKNINITDEDLHDFAKKLLEYNQFNFSSENESIACEHYCNGFVKDVFTSYKRMHGYISLAICIFGTIANILNIVVLTRKDMSKTPINTILKWLAVADMFLMIEYIPFSIYMYIGPKPSGQFKYSWSVYILFHMHFTQILHTISISLTVILALWRYIAIKHPHGRLASCVLSHCGVAILLSFVLAPILCLPTYFVFRINEKVIWSDNYTNVVAYHVDTKPDTTLYSINFWLFSVIIKLLPCLVLTVISFILIRVLCQAAKRKVKLKGYSHAAASASNINTVLNGHRPSKCQRRTDRTTMLLVAVLMLFLITEFPQGILGLLSGLLETCFFRKCYIPFGEMMDLLALINAAVGFVLYGLMSKQFRTSFKSVFFNKRLSRLEMTRITNLNNTTCV